MCFPFSCLKRMCARGCLPLRRTNCASHPLRSALSFRASRFALACAFARHSRPPHTPTPACALRILERDASKYLLRSRGDSGWCSDVTSTHGAWRHAGVRFLLPGALCNTNMFARTFAHEAYLSFMTFPLLAGGRQDTTRSLPPGARAAIAQLAARQ